MWVNFEHFLPDKKISWLPLRFPGRFLFQLSSSPFLSFHALCQHKPASKKRGLHCFCIRIEVVKLPNVRNWDSPFTSHLCIADHDSSAVGSPLDLDGQWGTRKVVNGPERQMMAEREGGREEGSLLFAPLFSHTISDCATPSGCCCTCGSSLFEISHHYSLFLDKHRVISFSSKELPPTILC